MDVSAKRSPWHCVRIWCGRCGASFYRGNQVDARRAWNQRCPLRDEEGLREVVQGEVAHFLDMQLLDDFNEPDPAALVDAVIDAVKERVQ
jgi:hypothetical protein